MRGGQKIYEERLQEFNDTHTGNNPYPRDGRFELIRTFNKYNKDVETAYFPQKLENFSPYLSDHKYRNLITAERDLVDRIEQTEQIHRMLLERAEHMLQYKLAEALDCMSNDIFIFRLPTGIGKTWRVKDLDEVTIAFPTNSLKEQIYGERGAPATAIMTPEFPVFNDDALNDSIDRLFKAGFVKQVHQLLWDLRKGVGCGVEDRTLAKDYLERNRAAQTFTGSVFTTHSRAIHSPFYHDTIIFDEDPLQLLLEVGTLKIADLKKINKNTPKALFPDDSTTLFDLQRYLEGLEEGEIQRLPDKFRLDITTKLPVIMKTEGIDSNLMAFLDSAYFYKDESDRDRIHFIHRNDLPQDKKIIIMSATIPVEIYKELYGQRVQVIDITDVAHQGTITQHTRYSYSRDSLEKHLEKANAKLADRPTITFKNFTGKVDTAAPDL